MLDPFSQFCLQPAQLSPTALVNPPNEAHHVGSGMMSMPPAMAPLQGMALHLQQMSANAMMNGQAGGVPFQAQQPTPQITPTGIHATPPAQIHGMSMDSVLHGFHQQQPMMNNHMPNLAHFPTSSPNNVQRTSPSHSMPPSLSSPFQPPTQQMPVTTSHQLSQGFGFQGQNGHRLMPCSMADQNLPQNSHFVMHSNGMTFTQNQQSGQSIRPNILNGHSVRPPSAPNATTNQSLPQRQLPPKNIHPAFNVALHQQRPQANNQMRMPRPQATSTHRPIRMRPPPPAYQSNSIPRLQQSQRPQQAPQQVPQQAPQQRQVQKQPHANSRMINDSSTSRTQPKRVKHVDYGMIVLDGDSPAKPTQRSRRQAEFIDLDNVASPDDSRKYKPPEESACIVIAPNPDFQEDNHRSSSKSRNLERHQNVSPIVRDVVSEILNKHPLQRAKSPDIRSQIANGEDTRAIAHDIVSTIMARHAKDFSMQKEKEKPISINSSAEDIVKQVMAKHSIEFPPKRKHSSDESSSSNSQQVVDKKRIVDNPSSTSNRKVMSAIRSSSACSTPELNATPLLNNSNNRNTSRMHSNTPDAAQSPLSNNTSGKSSPALSQARPDSNVMPMRGITDAESLVNDILARHQISSQRRNSNSSIPENAIPVSAPMDSHSERSLQSPGQITPVNKVVNDISSQPAIIIAPAEPLPDQEVLPMNISDTLIANNAADHNIIHPVSANKTSSPGCDSQMPPRVNQTALVDELNVNGGAPTQADNVDESLSGQNIDTTSVSVIKPIDESGPPIQTPSLASPSSNFGKFTSSDSNNRSPQPSQSEEGSMSKTTTDQIVDQILALRADKPIDTESIVNGILALRDQREAECGNPAEGPQMTTSSENVLATVDNTSSSGTAVLSEENAQSDSLIGEDKADCANDQEKDNEHGGICDVPMNEKSSKDCPTLIDDNVHSGPTLTLSSATSSQGNSTTTEINHHDSPVESSMQPENDVVPTSDEASIKASAQKQVPSQNDVCEIETPVSGGNEVDVAGARTENSPPLEVTGSIATSLSGGPEEQKVLQNRVDVQVLSQTSQDKISASPNTSSSLPLVNTDSATPDRKPTMAPCTPPPPLVPVAVVPKPNPVAEHAIKPNPPSLLPSVSVSSQPPPLQALGTSDNTMLPMHRASSPSLYNGFIGVHSAFGQPPPLRPVNSEQSGVQFVPENVIQERLQFLRFNIPRPAHLMPPHLQTPLPQLLPGNAQMMRLPPQATYLLPDFRPVLCNTQFKMIPQARPKPQRSTPSPTTVYQKILPAPPSQQPMQGKSLDIEPRQQSLSPNVPAQIQATEPMPNPHFSSIPADPVRNVTMGAHMLGSAMPLVNSYNNPQLTMPIVNNDVLNHPSSDSVPTVNVTCVNPSSSESSMPALYGASVKDHTESSNPPVNNGSADAASSKSAVQSVVSRPAEDVKTVKPKGLSKNPRLPLSKKRQAMYDRIAKKHVIRLTKYYRSRRQFRRKLIVSTYRVPAVTQPVVMLKRLNGATIVCKCDTVIDERTKPRAKRGQSTSTGNMEMKSEPQSPLASQPTDIAEDVSPASTNEKEKDVPVGSDTSHMTSPMTDDTPVKRPRGRPKKASRNKKGHPTPIKQQSRKNTKSRICSESDGEDNDEDGDEEWTLEKERSRGGRHRRRLANDSDGSESEEETRKIKRKRQRRRKRKYESDSDEEWVARQPKRKRSRKIQSPETEDSDEDKSAKGSKRRRRRSAAYLASYSEDDDFRPKRGKNSDEDDDWLIDTTSSSEDSSSSASDASEDFDLSESDSGRRSKFKKRPSCISSSSENNSDHGSSSDSDAVRRRRKHAKHNDSDGSRKKSRPKKNSIESSSSDEETDIETNSTAVQPKENTAGECTPGEDRTVGQSQESDANQNLISNKENTQPCADSIHSFLDISVGKEELQHVGADSAPLAPTAAANGPQMAPGPQPEFVSLDDLMKCGMLPPLVEDTADQSLVPSTGILPSLNQQQQQQQSRLKGQMDLNNSVQENSCQGEGQISNSAPTHVLQELASGTVNSQHLRDCKTDNKSHPTCLPVVPT